MLFVTKRSLLSLSTALLLFTAACNRNEIPMPPAPPTMPAPPTTPHRPQPRRRQQRPQRLPCRTAFNLKASLPVQGRRSTPVHWQMERFTSLTSLRVREVSWLRVRTDASTSV